MARTQAKASAGTGVHGVGRASVVSHQGMCKAASFGFQRPAAVGKSTEKNVVLEEDQKESSEDCLVEAPRKSREVLAIVE